MSELVTLAFHIKGANLTFELKLYQNVHYKCPASASHGIENIMAAPNLSSSDEGVGGARHELRWPTESALAFVKTLPDFFYGLANLPLFSGHAEDEGQGRSPDLNVYFSDV